MGSELDRGMDKGMADGKMDRGMYGEMMRDR
jgi:hypothetical protein